MKVQIYATRDPDEFGKGDQVVLFQRCRQLSMHPDIKKITVYVVNGKHQAKTLTEKLQKVEVQPIKVNFFERIFGFLKLFILKKKSLQSSAYYSKKLINIIEKNKDINIIQTTRLGYLLNYNPEAILEMIDPLSKNVFLSQKVPLLGVALEKVEQRRLSSEERQHCKNEAKIWLVSECDRNSAPFCANKNVRTIPLSKKETMDKKEKPIILGFHGTMSYRPNKEGAEYLVGPIAQSLRSHGGNFQIKIIGRNIEDDLIEYASKSSLCTMFCFSPKSISAALSGVDIYVAPILSGSGMQNKIIEAIQLEIPIITTRQAAGPFALIENVDVIIAKSLTDFSQAVIHLRDNPDFRNYLTSNAIERIKNLSDKEILKKMVYDFD